MVEEKNKLSKQLRRVLLTTREKDLSEFYSESEFPMPLVILTGFPSSGKSLRSQQLKDYLTEHLQKNVTIISENDFVKNKNDHSGNFTLS